MAKRGNAYKHGMRHTRQYNIWALMKARCDNKNCPAFNNYGGRGISYAQEWVSFENFWKDMKDGYSDDLTLERRDVNQGYSKENCLWATRSEQSKNKRNNARFNGLLLSEWSEILGVKRSTLAQRIYVYKWPIAEALTN